MQSQQDTPGSLSDVPKRTKHFFRNIGKKQIIYIVLPLLLINAGIAHLLVNQVELRAGAVNVVKDESGTLPDEGQVVSEQIPEDVLVEEQEEPVITTYVVKSGDTLSGIADKFAISINTIRWANNLTTKSNIKPGQELLILPVSGVEYTVKKGDTLSGIAAKFDIPQDDILDYNDVKVDAIKVGIKLILPGAEPLTPPAPAKKAVVPAATAKSTAKATTSTVTSDEPTQSNTKFILPIAGGTMTQSIHGTNAVDIGTPIGTKVFAAADGKVLATSCGRGYGVCLIINHADGSQTLYAHLSKILVSTGATVSQGDTIALSGNTGHSTGPHLHYEERGTKARNSISKFKVGTRF